MGYGYRNSVIVRITYALLGFPSVEFINNINLLEYFGMYKNTKGTLLNVPNQDERLQKKLNNGRTFETTGRNTVNYEICFYI